MIDLCCKQSPGINEEGNLVGAFIEILREYKDHDYPTRSELPFSELVSHLRGDLHPADVWPLVSSYFESAGLVPVACPVTTHLLCHQKFGIDDLLRMFGAQN